MRCEAARPGRNVGQLVIQLERLPPTYWSRVGPLLLAYMQDPDKYVQRRILAVRADMDPHLTRPRLHRAFVDIG